jgi:hypothetical protein
MKKALLLLCTVLLLNSFSALFAAEKATMPVLSEEDQEQLNKYFKDENELEYRTNPLISAIIDKKPTIIDYLIVNKPELIKKTDHFGFLPIKYADDLPLVKRLLPLTDLSPTKLLLMAGDKDINIIKYLIEQGADINGIDAQKQTPLMKAITSSNREAVNFFIEHKADITKEDRYGKSAISYVNRFDILNDLLNLEIFKKQLLDPKKNPLRSLIIVRGLKNDRFVNKILHEMKKQGSEGVNKAKALASAALCHEHGILSKIQDIKHTIEELKDSQQDTTEEEKELIQLNYIAHILLNYDATCENPKFKEELNEIKAQKINFDLIGSQGERISTGPMGIIHEYTGVKVPPTEEEIKEEAAQKQSTSATSATASTSALATGVKSLDEPE